MTLSELFRWSNCVMALPTQVKTYLSYWFQLGRGVQMPLGAGIVKPAAVLADGGYSTEFEALWQQLVQPPIAASSYLDGTEQTIAQLLDTDWEIQDCARCNLPIPMKVAGLPPQSCPCDELKNLPNIEEIPPRAPIDSQAALRRLCERLL
jgi:hypothetical protein